MRNLAVLLTALAFLLAGCGGGDAPQPQDTDPDPSGAQTSEAVQAPTDCSEAPLAAETPEGVEAPLSEVEPLTINASSGEEVELEVEIAENDSDRSQGLMYRESLGEECGMLFVFEEEQQLSFWMRNTLVPLSIAYIDSEGEIVSIHDMEPLDETSVPSEGPAMYALEVNQGFFEEEGVEVGDMVEIPG
jgi:uncharacterized protein